MGIYRQNLIAEMKKFLKQSQSAETFKKEDTLGFLNNSLLRNNKKMKGDHWRRKKTLKKSRAVPKNFEERTLQSHPDCFLRCYV